MPIRYFDVDPGLIALGYGFMGFADRDRQLREEQEARDRAGDAQRRRNMMIGGGAALGAIGGLALAGPLGLAGAAGGTVMATGVGAGAAIPVTAGLLGAGGVLSGTGALVAGLGGAAIGAQAGQSFAGGDYAGGIGAIAQGVAAPLVQQQARREKLSDWKMQRAGAVADALQIDKGRTDENVRQAAEEHSIKTTGRTVAQNQEREAAIQDYYASLSSGPQGGQIIGIQPGEPLNIGGIAVPGTGVAPMTAMGPESMGGPGGPPGAMVGPSQANVPGPSDIPGMDRVWGTGASTQWAQWHRDRQKTVDNPEWRNSVTPERLEDEKQALTRRARAIVPDLRPHVPTMQEVAAQQSWTDPRTKVIYHSKDVSLMLPSKDSEAGQPMYVDAGTGEQFALPKVGIAKLPDGREIEMGGARIVKPDKDTSKKEEFNLDDYLKINKVVGGEDGELVPVEKASELFEKVRSQAAKEKAANEAAQRAVVNERVQLGEELKQLLESNSPRVPPIETLKRFAARAVKVLNLEEMKELEKIVEPILARSMEQEMEDRQQAKFVPYGEESARDRPVSVFAPAPGYSPRD